MIQEIKINNDLTIYRGNQVEMDLFEKFFLYSKQMSLFFCNPFEFEFEGRTQDRCRCMIETFLLNNRFDNTNRIISRDMFTSFCENIENQKRFNMINITPYAKGLKHKLLNTGIELKELYCYKNMLFQPNALLYDVKTNKYFFYVPISLVNDDDIPFIVPNTIYQQYLIYRQLDKENILKTNPFNFDFLLDIINNKEQDKKSNELKSTLYQCVCELYSDKIKDYSLLNLKINERKTMKDYLDEWEKYHSGQMIDEEKYKEILKYSSFEERNKEIDDNMKIHFSNMFSQIARKYPLSYKIKFMQSKDIHKHQKDFEEYLIEIGKELSNTLNENHIYYQKILGKNNFDDVEDFINPNKKYEKKDNSHTR